jgi:hypothetical protein
MPDSSPNDSTSPPFYARGADLSRIPKAADIPSTDLRQVLGVDSANPFLRALRIERGFLNAADLPRELTEAAPFDGAALAKLRENAK